MSQDNEYKELDCLFIGHNEMDFEQYEKSVRSTSVNSGAYRDLKLNFINYNNKSCSFPDYYNYSFNNTCLEDKAFEPFSLGNTFSATIAYLGTYLHKRGYTFDYVNSFRGEKEQLADILSNRDIRIIAIPTTFYVSVFPILEIVSFVKKYNTSSKIVIGGPFVSTQVKIHDDVSLQFLFNTIGADIYIYNSQGETALVNIIKALKYGESLYNIKNIYYNDKSKYLYTGNAVENNELSDNSVNWRLFEDRIGGIVPIRSAISCPFSCSFCGFPEHAGKHRFSSLEAMQNELTSLSKIRSVKRINFIDDTINVPQSRFKDILRMIIKNGFEFKWNCNLRCQFIDEEMLQLMKESGCEGVFLGIESANQQILQNMNKQATVEQYKRGIELLKKYDMITYTSFIIGFPGETLDTVKDTVKFIEENQPDFYRTQLWYCDPLTPIWKEKEKYDIKNSQFEWSHATMDSHMASDLIDDIFLTLKSSIWVPQYNFEFVGVFNLLNRGMRLEEVKFLLNKFNEVIRKNLGAGANNFIN